MHNGARGLMPPALLKNNDCPICRGAGWVCEVGWLRLSGAGYAVQL
jgi:hypothetical protein